MNVGLRMPCGAGHLQSQTNALATTGRGVAGARAAHFARSGRGEQKSGGDWFHAGIEFPSTRGVADIYGTQSCPTESDCAGAEQEDELSRHELHTGQRNRVVTLGRGDDGLEAVALFPDVHLQRLAGEHYAGEPGAVAANS